MHRSDREMARRKERETKMEGDRGRERETEKENDAQRDPQPTEWPTDPYANRLCA